MRVWYRSLLGLGLLVLSVGTAFAQSHPCDGAAGSSARIAAGVTVHMEFCQPLAETIDAVTVYNGAVATNLTTLTQVTPSANAAGLVQYRIVLGSFAAATHTLQLSAWNKSTVNNAAQEGPKSSPFVLTAVVPNPAPSAPLILRVSP